MIEVPLLVLVIGVISFFAVLIGIGYLAGVHDSD